MASVPRSEFAYFVPPHDKVAIRVLSRGVSCWLRLIPPIDWESLKSYRVYKFSGGRLRLSQDHRITRDAIGYATKNPTSFHAESTGAKYNRFGCVGHDGEGRFWVRLGDPPLPWLDIHENAAKPRQWQFYDITP